MSSTTDRSRAMAALEPLWDKEVDILVVGSGAGGFSAALCAKAAGKDVLIVEKAPCYGGSTALSGGGIWIPNNPTLQRAGRCDDEESVRAYLHSVVLDRVPRARLNAFLDAGPSAMRCLEGSSPDLRFFWCRDYPDYHPELPGGSAKGRTVEALPFDLKRLGPEQNDIRRSEIPVPMGLWVTASDFRALTMVTRTRTGLWAAFRMAGRVLMNLVLRRRMVALGQSLIGRLRLALKQVSGELWLRSPLQELLVDEQGKVSGAVVETDGKRLRVRARSGVILATGGFDHNMSMRAQYLPQVKERWSAGSRDNTGDGLDAGVKLGAAIDLMDDAWWMPCFPLPNGSMFPLVSERSIPSAIIVGASGKRFANEAAPYVNFVHAQLEAEKREGGHVPAWLIADARAMSRYLVAGVFPGQPFPRSWYTSGNLHKSYSLTELARRIGVSADGLTATIERFNGFARAGKDLDFGRGDSAYDRYYGDPTLRNPCLAELTKPPFYGMRVVVGDLGTKGGLVCDEHGRVLREGGSPIPGLYATGNVSASVMGNDYAGAGATIGPSIVFGWLAARHAAGVPFDPDATRAESRRGPQG